MRNVRGIFLACGFILSLWTTPSHAQATFVKSTTGSAFAGTSVSATFGSSVAAGHSLRAAVQLSPGTETITSVTGATACVLSPGAADSVSNIVYEFIATNISSGTPTITVNLSGTTTSARLLVEEWAGDTTAACGSATDGNNGTYTTGTLGTNLPTGSFSASSGDSVWSVVYQSEGVLNTLPASFSLIENSPGALPFYTAVSNSVSGTINPTWVGGTGAFDNFVLGMSVKPVAAGVTAHNFSLMGVGQ